MSRLAALCVGGTLVLALLAGSGCSAMKWGADKEVADKGPPPGTCTVDFRPAKKSPQVGNVEITSDATVQQVLDRSKAFGKFSRMKVELFRQLPNGAWHRMVVEHDRGTKKVDPMHDYHVRPGDRVVITEDTTDVIDDMLSENMGPLNVLFGS
jgi:hypothetical protein